MGLADMLSKIDPKKIERLYPTREQFERFEEAKALATGVLSRAQGGMVSVQMLAEIDQAAEVMRSLYEEHSDKTELGSRARLNEAIFWAEAGLLERSVFLAGVAKERALKEPYKSQFAALPAHACLVRFRQVSRLEEWINSNFEVEHNSVPALILEQMRQSLLHQMNYFAGEAYSARRTHPLAAYMKMLATLLLSHQHAMLGNAVAASNLTQVAEEISFQMEEPGEDAHYMTLQYYVRCHREFATFVRLSSGVPRIRDRLEMLSRKASQIMDDGGGKRPKSWYWIGPFVSMGARAASVVGVVCLSAAALGIDGDVVREGIEGIWASVLGGLGDEVSALPSGVSSLLVADTGGLSRGLNEGVAQALARADLASVFDTGGPV